MSQSSARSSKAINPSAYNALADALTVIFWNKPPFERYVHGMLQHQSELLARLDFGATKACPTFQDVGLIQSFVRPDQTHVLEGRTAL
ncbi:hypothetical protein SSP24_64080 [Streptomyces spinoverrucosus]|uniref:Uncharacterized protein n=1 Tax=Streptomyces spinoverrucosus TaxID=284043 RepID=A0A4Y3VQ88_9ACTN|nr:hypothetical protein SSP24_64080 [Streptomyces spinoverrucosus]